MINIMDEPLYEEVKTWWESRGWPVLPKEFLPKRAYVVSLKEKNVCAGFLYVDESCKFSMLEWIISNPNTEPDERQLGIHELINFVIEEARKMGHLAVYTTSKSNRLCEKLEANGFLKVEENMTHFFKEI